MAQHACEVLDRLDAPVAEWRGALPEPAPPPGVDDALDVARRTAVDGRQRAVEGLFDDLQAVHDLRLQVRDELVSADDPDMRRVKPWVWLAESSGGNALTDSGAEVGCELRLSRYRS